jgi:hypothetical protein
MIKRNKVPTLIGIFILFIGVFAGVFLLKNTQIFKIGASATDEPKNITVSNLSDSSATISWTTGGATIDFLNWGKTQGNLNGVENENETSQKFFTHSITLAGLAPDTTYYYKINSNGTNFDNNGIPWQFATGDTLSGTQSSIPVSGSVISASGEIAKRAIVYINVNGYYLSTLTSDSGNFILQLGQVRAPDLKTFLQVDPANTLLQVSVEAESGDVASAQIYPQSANPIPPLVLGQVQDYRSLQPAASGQNPSANLSLPVNATAESKFDVSTPSGTPKPTSVILESVTEGETVTSDQPQFFGKGPAGEKITVTIHSAQAISSTVQIPKSGSWSYSPTTPLSPGSHSITVSWTDATGILRTLTRDFVVQAGEVPAFTASNSGSTSTPSPTPLASPKPTAKAGTPTPVPTLIASPTPTARPIPVTGDLTPTLLLFMMGVGVIVFSTFVWKKA